MATKSTAGLSNVSPIPTSGISTCPPDWQVTEPQGPGFARIYHITGGSAFYRDGSETRRLLPGRLYLFPENSAYQIRHDPAAPLQCVYLHASLFPLVFKGLLELEVEPGGFLDHLLQAMAACIRQNGASSVLQGLQATLVAWLHEKYPQDRLSPAILEVLHQIQENYRQPLTVNDLSSLAGWQDQYFIRRFRQTVGITPHQYLLRYRLHQASLLLLQGVSVSEAGLQVGYSDLKAFSKAFRAKYQIAPSRYRQFYLNMP